MERLSRFQILLLISVFLLNFQFPVEPLQFYQERIEVELKEDYCLVKGTYYIKNNSSQEIIKTLFYPFAINNELPFPFLIQVVSLPDLKEISFKLSSEAIYFPINVNPDSTFIFHVTYLQKTIQNKFEYILTTTKKWKRPLEYAEYIIRVPQNYKIKYLSLKHDRKEQSDKQIIFYCKKTSFMPQKNLIVTWEK